MVAALLCGVCDGAWPGLRRARHPLRTERDEVRCLESVVLDLVFVAAVVALFALVGAVASGVEKL